MELDFTSEGDLIIILEGEHEWVFFDSIHHDAGSSAELAAGLAEKIETQEDWREFVVPELIEQFDSGIQRVAKMIQKAKSAGANKIKIKKGEGEIWYQVLNQARLTIESKHKPNELRESEGLDEQGYKIIIRDSFYHQLQSVILNEGLDGYVDE